jgi:hypothetical protein
MVANTPEPTIEQNYVTVAGSQPQNRQNYNRPPPAWPLDNPNPDLAVKTPARAATTGANITLSALQTIDGVALAAGDRVLVKDQTDATTNGLYNATTGSWTRTIDANNNSQWSQGLQVKIAQGTVNANTIWTLTTANPITLGTSVLTFTGTTAAQITFTQIGTGAVARTVDAKLKDGAFSITDFGGAAGGADNAPALAAALAALPAGGGAIFFPPGKYTFNSHVGYTMPAGIFAVSLIGSGVDETILYWPTTGGITINYAGTGSAVHIRDMSITTGTVGGHTGLALSCATSIANPGYNALSDVTNVAFRGDDGYAPTATTFYWGTGLALTNISNINITGYFQGPFGAGGYSTSGVGLSFAGLSGSATYAAVINVTDSSFNLLNAGILYGSYAQGLTVVNSNLTGCTYGILVNPSESGTLSELMVTECQFNCTEGLHLGTGVDSVGVLDSLLLVPASGTGINLPVASLYLSIVGNTFDGTGASAKGINATASSEMNIVGNQLVNFSSGGTALTLGASVATSSVQSNIFSGNATNISNSSASTVIVNNPGYNPVGVTAAANVGASPATITAGASPETHYLNQSATNTATIAKSSQQIATLKEASTYYVVELGPLESYVVTWATTQPTYVKDVH